MIPHRRGAEGREESGSGTPLEERKGRKRRAGEGKRDEGEEEGGGRRAREGRRGEDEREAPGRFSPNTFAVHHLHFPHTTHIKITTSSTTPAAEQGTHCSSRPRTDTAAAAPYGRTDPPTINKFRTTHFYE
ncbi:hypothetical protein niasHT_008431 [Heterodera trifolii]|uniref:Uncharacterized protein n=1 Tax=Heterodera trifolii TaxID=157864 RepID=A0ABD2M3D0_9BILA